jgi:hypothetical protein
MSIRSARSSSTRPRKAAPTSCGRRFNAGRERSGRISRHLPQQVAQPSRASSVVRRTTSRNASSLLKARTTSHQWRRGLGRAREESRWLHRWSMSVFMTWWPARMCHECSLLATGGAGSVRYRRVDGLPGPPQDYCAVDDAATSSAATATVTVAPAASADPNDFSTAAPTSPPTNVATAAMRQPRPRCGSTQTAPRELVG